MMMQKKLSKEELAEIDQERQAAIDAAEENFNRLDTDTDGKVDKAELLKIVLQDRIQLEETDAKERAAKIQALIPIYDKHGDGQIRRSEWLAFFGHLFDLDLEMKYKKQMDSPLQLSLSAAANDGLKVQSKEEDLGALVSKNDDS